MVNANAHPWKALLLLAVLYTLLNSVKPLTIDDTAYYYFADHLSRQPLDPYGFTVFWWNEPEPANEVLAPLVLPYWWSLAIRLFGMNPFLWKLWLLPFSLLFVFALHALLRRFARSLEMPLTWMTVLSPTFLPGFNLMLDVPAVALSLAALVVFFRARERDSLGLAALAGLLAGLAMETKYTGFLAPAVMLLYALCFGGLRLWVVAGLMATQLFVSWQFLLALLYGDSHFLWHVRGSHSSLLHKGSLFLPFLLDMGGIAAAGALLALTALGVRRRTIVATGALLLLGYGLVASFHTESVIDPAVVRFFSAGQMAKDSVFSHDVIFGVMGTVVCGVAAAVLWRLCPVARRKQTPRRIGWRTHRTRWFLLLWLGLEVVGYLFLTPFPAVRRLMGVVVAGSMVGGYLASRTCRSRERRSLLHGVVAFGVALGLGFYALDLREAVAEKEAVEAAAAFLHSQPQQEGATTWYVGHWGFQFYAEQHGMKPVVPHDPRYWSIRPSRLRAGDWLVAPDLRLHQQAIGIDPTCIERLPDVLVNDPVPLRTVWCYYAGRTALEHDARPRVIVHLYRVTRDFVPAALKDPQPSVWPEP